MAEREYAVGYGKPPVEHRFQTGSDGPRKGRKKGELNLRTDVEQVLGELITVKVDGRPRKITKQRALIMQTVSKALEGDHRFGSTVFDLVSKFFPKADNLVDEPLPEDDRAILESYRRRDSSYE